MQSTACRTPTVLLLGELEHPDFIESVSLVRATAHATSVADARQAAALLSDAPPAPQLIVFAASRPGVIRTADVERLRRFAPLAGFVALLGNWCEGETRSGRPAAGVGRVYWYDFPAWWRRQLDSWIDGRCPEWARPEDMGMGASNCPWQRAGSSAPLSSPQAPTPAGLVVLDTTCHDTAASLAAVLQPAGFATAWASFGCHGPQIRGAVAGIWEGRQLDDRELPRLAAFCGRVADDQAPVIALADFPRRDRVECAGHAGAAAVLGKPWRNDELVATLQLLISARRQTAPPRVARAA